MEHPMARRGLAGDCTKGSASEHHVRCRRLIVYRPSPEKQCPPAPLGLEEKNPPLCWLPQGRARRQSERLLGRQRRLQQGGQAQWGQGTELWLVASPMERSRQRISRRDPSSAHPITQSLSGQPLPGEALPSDRSSEPGSNQIPGKEEPTMDRTSPEEQSSPASQSSENKASPSCCPLPGTTGSEPERLLGKRWLLQKEVPHQNWLPRASPTTSHWGKELVSSPTERAQQHVLTVALEECPIVPVSGWRAKGLSQPRQEGTDADLQQEDLLTPSSPSTAAPLTASSSSDQWQHCSQPDAAPGEMESSGSLLPAVASSAWPPPICSLLRPQASVPRFRHWGITPFFQTVKSKLETFADIFLSPAKPRLCPLPPPRLEEEEGPLAESTCPEEEPAQSRGGPSQLGACSPRQGVNIEVKIAISEPAERGGPGKAEDEEEGDGIVCRRPSIHQWRLSPEDPRQPRLGRSYSCPDFPWAMPSPLPAPIPCPARRRRHTVCSLEVSRELLQGHPLPSALPCLRKEVFPFPLPASRRLLSPVVRVARCDEACSSCPGPPCHEEPDAALLSARDHSQGSEQEDMSHGPTMDGIVLSHTDTKNSQEGTTGKVSHFRIRKTPAKQQANLTPMGLPRPVRLDKKEFSLEEIYTNKNYRTPTEKRTFETIFEEPRERNGALVLTSQRKLKRTMEFQDSSLPRKQRRSRSRGRLAGRVPGGRRAPPQHPNLEELLQQRLAELDALFEADGD